MSKLVRRLVFTVLGSALILGGCVVGFTLAQRFAVAPVQTQVNSGTPTPDAATLQALSLYDTQIAATAQVVTGGLLLDDPWVFVASETDSSVYTIKNTEAGLIVTNRDPNSLITASSDVVLPPDVDVSVTGQGMPPSPCPIWYYSLNFRVPAHGEASLGYYQFLLWRYEGWALYHSKLASDLGPTLLASGDMDDGFEIMQPTTLRAVVKGSHFELYINNKQVGSVDDSREFGQRNYVAFSVYTCADQATTLFTNLLVRAPR